MEIGCSSAVVAVQCGAADLLFDSWNLKSEFETSDKVSDDV